MIEEKIKQLIDMTDEEWGMYAFSRDPIHRKISKQQTLLFIKEANACGKEAAKKLKEKYKGLSIKEYADQLGLQIKKEDLEGSDDYIVFAKYNYPKDITLYMKNIEYLEAFIVEKQLQELLENANIENVLLAHEMYHYCEEHWTDMYSKETTIVLWKIGKFSYKSKVIALGEIAAMAFAKELIGLTYNPYLFDSLLLYPHNSEKATKLMEDIFAFRQKEKEAADE